PFFLVSCAHALRFGDARHRSASTVDGPDVPWDIVQGVRQRIAVLPRTAQELLGVAAAGGRGVPRAVVEAVLGRSDEALLAALRAVRKAHLLEEDGRATYRFAHDVIREVMEADLGAAQRALLHRRIAEVLAWQQGEPAADDIAYHYTQT